MMNLTGKILLEDNITAMCSLCGGGSSCSCGSCGICNCGSCFSGNIVNEWV